MNAGPNRPGRAAAGPTPPVRVAVLHARPVMAEGLAVLLADCDGIDIVGATTHVGEAIRMVAEAGVQVVVFAIEDQTVLHLRRLVTRFTAAAADAGHQIGLVGIVPGDQEAVDRFSSPELPTVVSTSVSPEALRDTIMSACPGNGWALPLQLVRWQTVSAVPDRPAAEPRLTRRERDVLRGIEKGLSTQEIAGTLGISVNTVRTHVQHLMPKLGVHSRLQAGALGAIDPRPEPPGDQEVTR